MRERERKGDRGAAMTLNTTTYGPSKGRGKGRNWKNTHKSKQKARQRNAFVQCPWSTGAHPHTYHTYKRSRTHITIPDIHLSHKQMGRRRGRYMWGACGIPHAYGVDDCLLLWEGSRNLQGCVVRSFCFCACAYICLCVYACACMLVCACECQCKVHGFLAFFSIA